jgi:hypothetical protein
MRDRERHGGVLLDQQDRHALAVDIDDRVEDLLHEDRRRAHARLVRRQEPPDSAMARPMREHLRSPPDRVPATW